MTAAGVDGGTRQRSRRREWVDAARPVVGVVVLLLWLAWAVLTWQLEPRTVSVPQVRADIASGQILTYRVTSGGHPKDAWLPSGTSDGWDTLGLDETTGLPDEGTDRARATGIVYWVRAPYAQTRFFDAGNSSNALGPDGNPTTYESLVREMRAGGVPLESPELADLPNQDSAFFPGWGAIALGFGGVLFVYRPTRVNRWGWLWLMALVPYGLGLVALALVELLRPTAKPGPRWRGGRAFVLAWVLRLTIGTIYLNTPPLWIP